jgi:hypothetical protein
LQGGEGGEEIKEKLKEVVLKKNMMGEKMR